MRLHIIRHGKAEQESPTGLDRDRPLRRKGESQAQWLGRALADRPLPPVLLIASPFTRARRTAEILREELGIEFLFDERLEVGAETDDAIDALAEHAPHEQASVALVGHNPQLERLARRLLLASGEPAAELRTGECLIFELSLDDTSIVEPRFVARLRLDDGEPE